MWTVTRDDLAMGGGAGVLAAVIAVVVAGCGTATVPRQKQLAAPGHSAAASRPARVAMGTGSTPGVLSIPQMGFVSFRCDRAFRVQPFFSTRGAINGDDVVVTVRAGNVVRRNFATRVVHQAGKTLYEMAISPRPIISLPYAHYRLVTFAVREGSEARILDARVSAQFVARRVRENGRTPLGACLVKRWSLALAVR
jgi:hypothetical protein